MTYSVLGYLRRLNNGIKAVNGIKVKAKENEYWFPIDFSKLWHIIIYLIITGGQKEKYILI